MKLFTNKKKLQNEIKGKKNIIFVPTMGSLHKGHESLIKKSIKKSNVTIVSIFVNPKQFNSKKDFNSYPRNYNKDLKLLSKLKVNYVYKPNYNDIFNFKTNNKIFLDKFSKRLCGKHRKGHFKGVVEVVNRMLEIIKPKHILLGNKDFQQLVLIKRHIRKNKIQTKVISCKTIRDKNFIAYSSRLKKLKKLEKKNLIRIIKVLKKYKKDIQSGNSVFNFTNIKKKVLHFGAKRVDYIEPINLKNLKTEKRNKFNLFFAFHIGNIRFIDNF